jgi:Domain of unknown function (DUF1708)
MSYSGWVKRVSSNLHLLLIAPGLTMLLDSQFARDAFATFIPMSVDSEARKQIVFAFFDLMAAVAAHGKSNGLGGRKLSRYAGWWAFEHYDMGKGFNAGYRGWAR